MHGVFTKSRYPRSESPNSILKRKQNAQSATSMNPPVLELGKSLHVLKQDDTPMDTTEREKIDKEEVQNQYVSNSSNYRSDNFLSQQNNKNQPDLEINESKGGDVKADK